MPLRTTRAAPWRPRDLRAGLVVLVLLLVAPFAAVAEEAPAGPSIVRADAGLEALAEEARSLLPSLRLEVDARLGFDDAGRQVEVAIVSGHRRAAEVAGAAVPEWAVGVAISSRALIVLRADLLRRGFGSGLAPVLRHELVHLAWGRHAHERRRALPLWVEEGVAEHIGGGVSVDAGAALDVAVAFDNLLTFESLTHRFPDAAVDADLAYKQSRSWVSFFVERESWEALRGILEAVAEVPDGSEVAGATFADLVRQRSSMSLGEWHAAWRLALEEQAAPWFHLLYRDLSTLLIAALAVLGLALFFFLRRRRRRQIATLPDGPEVVLGTPEDEGP